MSRSLYLNWSDSDFRNNSVHKFKTYLSNECFTDVTLAAEGLTLKAHRMVLSACSSFFQSIFLENSSQHPIVVLKDVKYTDLKLIIDFMYEGGIEVREDQIDSLQKTAQSLQVHMLADMRVPCNMLPTVIDIADEPDSDTPSNIPSNPPPKKTLGEQFAGNLLDESEIKRSDSDIEDFNEDLGSDVRPSYTSTVPLEVHALGDTPLSVKDSPMKFMTQTPITDDDLQSHGQSNNGLPDSFFAASTPMAVDGEVEISSDCSAVPLKNPNIISSHESQVEQSNEQGSDENFEPEPDLMETHSSESKESSVSDLIEYSPTEHDAHSSQFQTTVKPSAELPNTSSDHSSHYKSTVKSSIELSRTGSEHSSQHQSTKKSSVGVSHTSSSHSNQHQSTEKSSVEVSRTSSSNSSQHQPPVKPSATIPSIIKENSSCYRVTLSSSDVLTVQTQIRGNSQGTCLKKIIVPKDMDIRSLELSSIQKPDPKKRRVRFNEDVQKDVHSSDGVKKTVAEEKKNEEESESRKVLVRIGTNGVVTRTEKYFRCKKCSFKTSYSLSLKRHVNSQHEQSPKFKCDKCNFEASLKENLARHTAEVHEIAKQFECTLCSYKCDQEPDLKRHVENVHEKKKPHMCELCKFSSAKKTSLKKHIAAVHEHRKDFACEYCAYRSAAKGNLKRHVKLMHEKKKSGKETKKDDYTSDEQD